MRRRTLVSALPIAGALVLFLFACPASAGVLVNTALPFEQVVPVPCALNGSGEDVQLGGFLHVLVTATFDGKGVLHATTHFQPMGVAGTGLTTGDVYRATGITRDEVNGLGVPFETTFVNTFRIVGPGKGNNVSVHEVFHVTVNALGEMTASVELEKTECK